MIKQERKEELIKEKGREIDKGEQEEELIKENRKKN